MIRQSPLNCYSGVEATIEVGFLEPQWCSCVVVEDLAFDSELVDVRRLTSEKRPSRIHTEARQQLEYKLSRLGGFATTCNGWQWTFLGKPPFAISQVSPCRFGHGVTGAET